MIALHKMRLPLSVAGSLAAGLLAVNSLRAQSWEIGPFVRPLDAPVIEPNRFYYFIDPLTQQKTLWDDLATFDPGAAIAPDGEIALLFHAEGDSGESHEGDPASRLALATSRDGLFFTVDGTPLLYPRNTPLRVQDARDGLRSPRVVVAPDGGYVMTYTQSSPIREGKGGAQDKEQYTIEVATAKKKSLRDWTERGPAFADASRGSRNKDAWRDSGSGAILTELHHGRLQAAKLHGRYWMYWGSRTIHLATSTDLIHWTPVLDRRTGRPLIVLGARAGHFDSGAAEAGPPPLLTRRGIILIYNGENSLLGTSDAKNSQATDAPAPAVPPDPAGAVSKATGSKDKTIASHSDPPEARLPADPTLRPGAYAVGEALFSSADPSRLVERTEHPVLQPIWPYERNGQYNAGAVRAEGLVIWQGQWLLYYGAADSVIGVARAPMR